MHHYHEQVVDRFLDRTIQPFSPSAFRRYVPNVPGAFKAAGSPCKEASWPSERSTLVSDGPASQPKSRHYTCRPASGPRRLETHPDMLADSLFEVQKATERPDQATRTDEGDMEWSRVREVRKQGRRQVAELIRLLIAIHLSLSTGQG